MKTTEVIYTAGVQAVKLPEEFRFQSEVVSIRREGEAVVLEPIKLERWPDGFFERIRIDDPRFSRPNQGPMPPAPKLD
jgi:virulence-associated protein VagC